jgi:formylglycine-generating enzyme required for sulfatase activity
MGKYEVTQAEYESVMGTNPSYFKGANLSVENASWYDAVEYRNRLSQREGLTPAYTRNGDNVTWNRNAERGTGCPRRRNGNTPAGRGPPRRLIQETTSART